MHPDDRSAPHRSLQFLQGDASPPCERSLRRSHWLRPAFSIIVRTVERTERLRECLESIARQTFCDFEVILVDMSDGACAGAGVIAEFHSRLPAFVHLKMKRRCRPVALNFGIQRARGETIAVLDDDNCWEPEHLQTLGFSSTNADLVYTGVKRQTFSRAGELMHENRHFLPFDFQRLVRGNYIYATATAYRRQLWQRVSGYDNRFSVYEDWDFLIRATRNARVIAIPSFTAISRSFTGETGIPEHSFHEPDDCRHCLAAIRWKHRRICPENVRHYRPRELRQLLINWWWRNQLRRFSNVNNVRSVRAK